MLGRTFRMVTVGVAASAAVLMMGAGAAHAKPGGPIQPINPCAINPQGCQGPPPPIKFNPCLIDPNACLPPTTVVPQPPKPKTGSGSLGTSSGTGSSGSVGDSSLTGTATVRAVRHPSSSGSGTDPLVIGSGAALAASLAGLGAFAVWRRRALA
jgi:hypothetical protein